MKLSDKADWLAIAMHFTVGAVVGGASSLLGLAKFGQIYKNSGETVIGCILCVSVIFGSGYALLQNEAWIGDNYRVIPPIPPKHSRASVTLLCSLIVLAVPATLLCLYLS